MVEFGMTFIFFIFIILAVINLILLAYNFNLAQRTAWECARRASVGASNNEIREIIYSQFIEKMFASPFLMTKLTFDSRSFVVPNDQYDRIQSEYVTINMGFRAGFSFLLGSAVTANFPVTSSLYMIAPNDADGDGRYDTRPPLPVTTQTGRAIAELVDTLCRGNFAMTDSPDYQADHDNDRIDDVRSDTDDDNDGIPDAQDFGFVGYDNPSSSYVIDSAGYGNWIAKPSVSKGRFAARPIWLLSDFATFDSGPRPIFPMAIPRDRYSTNGTVAIGIRIDMSRDTDNDGREDKFVKWQKL